MDVGADVKSHRISKRCKFLIIIIVTSVITATAIAIAIFLLRHWVRARKRKSSKSGGMLVWTNQLSTLQHPEFSNSESNSRSVPILTHRSQTLPEIINQQNAMHT